MVSAGVCAKLAVSCGSVFLTTGGNARRSFRDRWKDEVRCGSLALFGSLLGGMLVEVELAHDLFD